MKNTGRVTYNSSPRSQDDLWMIVSQVDDVLGDCKACGRKKVVATRTVYGDGAVRYRCHGCGRNDFTEHPEEWYDNPARWKPLGNDELEGYIAGYNPNFEQANKRGTRKTRDKLLDDDEE